MSKFKQGFIRLLIALLVLPGAFSTELLHLATAHADQAPDVVINEVMWMGSTVSSADEWLELRNTTASPIDVSGWRLTNAGTSGSDLVLPSSPTAVIPANGYYLISNFSDASASSILNLAPDAVTTAVSLSNTCNAIVLEKVDLSPIDTMGCDGSSYFGNGNTAIKRALERNVDVTDGTVTTSWHDSVGFANLDVSAASNNFATPKTVNDMTAPVSVNAVVRDGSGADIDFTVSGTALTANWSGFTDPEDSVSYQVGVGTTAGSTNIVDWTAKTLTSHTFSIPTPPGWLENQTLYVAVKAVNAVNLESAVVSSNGVTLNTVDPATPTNLTVIDVPQDQGGSLQASWSPSTAADVTSYQLNYRQSGVSSWTNQNVGLATTKLVSGLANAPTTYEFTVEAIDFNGQHSLPTAIVTGQATATVADATGPNSPTLEMLTSRCGQTSCRVQLNWQDNGPDSQTFQLIYRSNGVTVRSFELTSLSVALDVSANRSYDFTVIALDRSGNSSAESNVFSARLVANQSLTIQLKNGQPVTTVTSSTKPVSVVRAKQVTVQSKTATLVPVAQAAEPTDTLTPTSETTQAGTSQDWVRIFVVIVLLLIVAGSFYALSRSFREEKEDNNEATTEADASKTSASKPSVAESVVAETATTTRRRRRRRRRR